MKHLLKKSTLVALVLLNCTTMVHGQVVSAAVDAVVSAADVPAANPAPNSVPAAVVDPAPTVADPAPTVDAPVTNTTPAVVPTTTVAPPATVPTTTNAPANPPAAATTTTTAAQGNEPSKADPVASDKSTNAGTSKPTGNTNNETDKNNSSSSTNVSNNNPSGSKNNSSQPSQTGSTSKASNGVSDGNTSEKEEGSGSNKTAIIAGSVVGGLVGIALIAGLLTWLNRHGGCTSRTRRRDIQQDFNAHDNEYDLKMTENVTGGGVGMVASNTGAMHSSDNLPPPAPFQRRFVPPTSNPTGYMNLTDEEYGYHNGQTNGYQQQQQQQQQQQNYGSEYDYQQQQQQHPEYQQQEYRNEYAQQQPDFIPHHEYANNDYTNTTTIPTHGAAYGQTYYHTNSNVTSPTLTNVTATGMNDPFRQQLKPDQIEQKPNEL
ncbi:hypothetical protein BD770DRAFT_383036 [Pilaira anomala]|nr:hypothetical protein BD770DRAFT_383036 [Pilaira anomala]